MSKYGHGTVSFGVHGKEMLVDLGGIAKFKPLITEAKVNDEPTELQDWQVSCAVDGKYGWYVWKFTYAKADTLKKGDKVVCTYTLEKR